MSDPDTNNDPSTARDHWARHPYTEKRVENNETQRDKSDSSPGFLERFLGKRIANITIIGLYLLVFALVYAVTTAGFVTFGCIFELLDIGVNLAFAVPEGMTVSEYLQQWILYQCAPSYALDWRVMTLSSFVALLVTIPHYWINQTSYTLSDLR
jgi:hypothetical protein